MLHSMYPPQRAYYLSLSLPKPDSKSFTTNWLSIPTLKDLMKIVVCPSFTNLFLNYKVPTMASFA